MSSIRDLARLNLLHLKIDSAKVPLRWMLVIPFVLLTTGATALVGYLSYQAGQEAVEDLANQLLQQTSARVSDHLSNYLEEPQQIVAANQLAARQGNLDLNNPEQLRQQFWQQMIIHPALPANAFWRDRGVGLGYGRLSSKEAQAFATKVTGKPIPTGTLYWVDNRSNQRQFYWVNSQGQLQQLIYTVKADFSRLAWYEQAKAVDQQHWAPTSINAIMPVLQVMAVAPAYDAAGEFQGLFVSNYLLTEISRFLHSLDFSPDGQVFIMERSGNLIATSDPSEASATAEVNGKPARLAAIGSKNPIIREVSQQLLQQYDPFTRIQNPQQFRLTVQGQGQFVQVMPYRDRYGLDWLVVTTIPETDFMARIQAQNIQTLWLCLGTLAATSALGVLAARRITDPLGRLSLAADRIAQNQFDHEVPVMGLGEVKQLSSVFHQMAEQLRLSFQLRTDYEQELRQEVARRTFELAQAKDLREVIFNESTDAIFLVGSPPSTLILDCNQRAVEMFEQAHKGELIGTLGTSLQKHPLNLEEINAVAAEMAEKGYWSREFEYVTRSGRSFWANLAAKTIAVAGETMQLIRLTDISDRKQLEFALQDSESRTKDILNSAIAGIARMRVFKNGNWSIDQVSAGTELLCGYSAEALTQDSHLWVSLIDREDWEASAEQMFAHIFAGTTYTHEYRLRRKDGQMRWISQTNNSNWDEMQQCWNLTAISIDITDRKQAELALQQSEATLREAQRVAHVGSWEFEVETQTTFWSEELYRIYQCDPQQPPPHLEALLARFIHSEDKALFESFVDRLTQEQSAEQDFRITLADGSTRYIAAKGEPVFNQSGKLVRLIGTVLDVTDRRKAELALRQSERKFKGAFDTITTGMALVSLAGGFQEVNASLCQMLGYSPEELLALRLQDVVHPEDQQLSLTALEQMMASEIPGYQIEKRFLRQDGQSVWGLLNIALMRDTDNYPLYLIAQIVDMSERHRLNVIKDEFISVVSHELRTPLTSIRGSLGILDTGILSDEPETAQQMLSLALRSTDRLVRLVNDILDLERLESGKVVLVKEVCEVNDLMEQAIDSVQILADQANIELRLIPLADQVEADPDAIVQTLTNLLSNAIKFSPAGGMVSLRAERLAEGQGSKGVGEWSSRGVGEQGAGEQGSRGAREQGSRGAGETSTHSPTHPPTHSPTHPPTHLLLSVTDQGRGIPPEKLESIFGRFQQVDSSDSRQKGGTGLGLAICRSIVQQHGGQIWVESEVGQGSTFYFTLPVALEQESKIVTSRKP